MKFFFSQQLWCGLCVVLLSACASTPGYKNSSPAPADSSAPSSTTAPLPKQSTAPQSVEAAKPAEKLTDFSSPRSSDSVNTTAGTEPNASEAVGKAESASERGLASWYGPRFQGKRTASGERFDTSAMTAAHKTWPFGTKVRVKSVSTGKEVVVRINDRGPFIKGRIIDLSNAAAKALGFNGVHQVEIARLP